MLRKGNYMIFEDIYWSWIAYDRGEFDDLICVLQKDIHSSTDAQSKAKTIEGWKQIKRGVWLDMVITQINKTFY